MTKVLTDSLGRAIGKTDTMDEPEPGSVLLTEGDFGTAWQRFFSDGLWHPCRGGKAKPWADLVLRRNVVLVYDAEVRRTVTRESVG